MNDTYESDTNFCGVGRCKGCGQHYRVSIASARRPSESPGKDREQIHLARIELATFSVLG